MHPAQPLSPHGDSEGGGLFKPQMQGHHEFNPKEASTLLIAEESQSFCIAPADEPKGMANNRISEMLGQPSEPTFDESRPSMDVITSTL